MTAGLRRGLNLSQIRRVAQQLEETYVEMNQPVKIDSLKKRVAYLLEQENQEVTFPLRSEL
jgi:division protein CdvB (Snf7/Vps24/ESCRT-III family)